MKTKKIWVRRRRTRKRHKKRLRGGQHLYIYPLSETKIYNGNNNYYKIIFNNGEYIGGWDFNKKKREGTGIMRYTEEKNVYEGEWRDDKKNGTGIMRYESGDKYEGEWENDKMNGKGKYTIKGYSNGFYKRRIPDQTYFGDWTNGMMNGKIIFNNGKNVYLFEFENGIRVINSKGKRSDSYDTTKSTVPDSNKMSDLSDSTNFSEKNPMYEQ